MRYAADRLVDCHGGLYGTSGATRARWTDVGGPPARRPRPVRGSVRLARIVHHGDRTDFDSSYPAPARRLLRDLGLHSVVAVPLTGDSGVIGSVVLGRDESRRFDPVELLPLTTVAGFSAQALHRAEPLQHRIGVAQQLQNAMLSPLPAVPGVVMAARYRSADSREHVGGDWYDAAVLARLTTLLDRHRDVSCQRLVDTVVERLAADAADDVVVLALRIPWAPGDESALIGRTHRAGHPAPGAGAVATRT